MAHRFLLRPQLNGDTLGGRIETLSTMPASREVNLRELESRLGDELPKEYREYVTSTSATVLKAHGFDPKTLLVLNLQLRSWSHIDCQHRFFLSGDGCGNYYFAKADDDVKGAVYLWSHEEEEIEDHDIMLATFLREAEQMDRIDWPVREGELYVCRSFSYAESILQPIELHEWLAAVEATIGIEHVGFRQGLNPFTKEIIRIESPGLAKLGGRERADVTFYYGRAKLPDDTEGRSVAADLAEKLGAHVEGVDTHAS